MIQFEVHKTYKTPLRIKDKTSVNHEYHYIQSLFIFTYVMLNPICTDVF